MSQDNNHNDSSGARAVDGKQRRDLLKGFGLVAGAAATSGISDGAQAKKSDNDASSTPLTHEITITINGDTETYNIDARTTLVDLLREQLNMMGTKKGCDHGACGACTVHVDGRRVLSCLTLAATIDGADITTIEGISSDEKLHPMQDAFLRCDGYQCGYCTPGQIMSAIACVEEGHAKGTPEEAREWMSGNLCRCSAYPNILAALRQASGAEPIADPAEPTL